MHRQAVMERKEFTVERLVVGAVVRGYTGSLPLIVPGVKGRNGPETV